MGFSRSGMPTQYEPWHADWAASGNGFEVDLVPDYKILHDAGYNVLAYDLRNHGLSSAANGGVSTHGITEWRDVAGSLAYARTRPGTGGMTIGLFSRCMGAVATFAAMTRFPAAFDGVRCLVSPQPVTPRFIVQRRLAVMGLGDRLEDFDTLIRLRTSVGLGQRVPQEWARNVRVPTFLYQVRGDILTDPSDVQAMFDNIPAAGKKLQWIEGTTARWDGYLEFQRRPQPMLDWFAQYMS
jgi:pimeloyl-ACP methyl ester carboxylesterase